MNAADNYNSDVYWELPGTENKDVCTAFSHKGDVGCTFPGPQNASFLRLFFYQPFSPAKKRGGRGDAKNSSYIRIVIYLFALQSKLDFWARDRMV